MLENNDNANKIGVMLGAERVLINRLKGCTCKDWLWYVSPPVICTEFENNGFDCCLNCSHDLGCHA